MQFGQSRLNMAKISYFSNEIKLSLNCILSEIFEILYVDNQTVTSCGWNEPHRSPIKEDFSCVIGIYLMSFFYEHPVCISSQYKVWSENKVFFLNAL